MLAGSKGKIAKLALICACIAAPLATASEATASRPYEFKKAFGAKCLAEPCEGESLKRPSGVAVNEESGDVYVVDEGANRVVRFDESGKYLSEFNGSGKLAGEGKAAGSGGKAGEFETGRFSEPQTIAVDNTCKLREYNEADCKVKDPSNGDVYLVDAGEGHRVVDKYSPAGEYVGQIAEGEEGGVVQRFEHPLDGVAIDPQGAVWVYQETRVLQKYSDARPNAFLEAKKVLIPCCEVPGFAIDAKGDFYLRHTVSGFPRIAKLDPSGKVITGELLKEDANSVAADQGNSNALIDNNTSVALLNPKGAEFERLGEEHGLKHLTEATGIGPNAGASSAIVAEAGVLAKDAAALFGPSEPSPPKVEGEAFAKVTAHEASLEAQINPRSEVGEEASKYRFEYGRCLPPPQGCAESGYEARLPEPEGQIEADFEVHAVGLKLEGLQANTTYHFRAVAKNSHGPGEPGAEVSFTTQTEGGELVLPDNRAWELVSPPDKLGALIEPIAETGVVQAAAGGGGITYLANAPTEAEPAGYSNKVQVLSRRGASAWSTRDIAIPHTSATGLSAGSGQEYKFFDPELALSAVQPFGQFIPELSEEASESTAYLHNLEEGCGSHCYRPLVTGKPGFSNVPEGTQFGEEQNCTPGAPHLSVVCGPEFLGASEDFSHVVLRSKAALTPGSIEGELYEWSGGALAQLSVSPEEAPIAGAGLGNESRGSAQHAIASDGSRVVWEAQGALYLRDTTRNETVQLDAPEAGCASCKGGDGQFQIASADDSRIFFTDTQKLTEGSGSEAGKRADLYECRIVSSPKLGCELSDLTPPRGEEAAEVQGSVLGASEDGSSLYFVAKGVQSEAPNARGQSAIAGKPNLYLRHGSSTEFIATLAGGDETDWELFGGTSVALQSQPTRVSPDGQFLELMSEASLTGYDNRDAASGKPAAEVYLYDAATKELRCASCQPSGVRPVGVEYRKLEPESGGLVGGPRNIWPASALVAANVPGWTAMAVGQSRYQPRYLSNEGRLFFNSADALVPEDANGTQDVYQYEPPGIGNCSEASETFSLRSGGCVALISSGSSTQESAFLDASESGSDVFFLTSARLSAIDTDDSRDVYDAHVCTGAEPCITYKPREVTSCESEAACKAPPSPGPQIFGAPPSAILPSTGNLPPAGAAASTTRKTPEQIRIEALNKALRACRAKHNKKQRQACERAARKRYAKPGTKPKAKGKKAAQKNSARGGHR